MSKKRALSKDAEKWFNDTHRVLIEKGQFIIMDRATNRYITTKGRYLGMLQYAKDCYVSHCRDKLKAKP